ncbi:unnamed protein product, partial [Ectocarpus sp. 8 AP-2014]
RYISPWGKRWCRSDDCLYSVELHSDHQVRSERGPDPWGRRARSRFVLVRFCGLSAGNQEPNATFIAWFRPLSPRTSYSHACLSLRLVPIMASRVLDKKLKKVLDMRTDTPALLE